MTSPPPRPTLQLPRTDRSERRVFKRPRRLPRWRQLLTAVALTALGVGLLVLLLQVPERFNTVLVLSQALLNLITGVRQFLIGVVQLLILVVLVLVAVLGLALVGTGLVRMVRVFASQPRRGVPPRSR